MAGSPEHAERPRYDPFDPDAVPEQIVDAAELVRPFIEPASGALRRWRRQSTNAPIVQVENAYITGRLDLRGADLRYLFRFERCRFEQVPDVREANLLGLVFRRCRLPGLHARNLRTGNDLRLIKCNIEVDPETADIDTTVRRVGEFDRGLPDAAVNLTDSVVEGSVVFTGTRVHYPRSRAIQADRLVVTGAFLAYRLSADGEVRVPGLRTGGNVNFSGARLRNPDGFALNANGAHIGGSLRCEVERAVGEDGVRPFSAAGLVYLAGARIAGDINLRGARLRMKQGGALAVDAWKTGDWYVDPWPALVADRLQVDGNVELSDGFDVTGTVRLVNSRIGGSLRMSDAHIRVLPSKEPPFRDRAVHLDGSEINGDVDGQRMRVRGQLRLADVAVRGNVHLTDGTFVHPGRDVLSARRSTVSGNMQIKRSSAKGTLRLMGMTVGGSIDLRAVEVSDPEITEYGHWAVDLRSVKVARSVLLTSEKRRPPVVRGGVTTDGAAIARQFDVTDAELHGAPNDGEDPKDGVIALDAGDTSADEFVLRPGCPPRGRVVLLRSQCGTLDDSTELWLATGGLALEDFHYGGLAEPIAIDDHRAVRRRLTLLHDAIGGYRPGPYDQFAAMLRSGGNEDHADWVLAKKQQYRYESLAHGRPVVGLGVRLWSLLQRWMVGYGYRPVRAIGLLVLLLVGGSLWFGLRSDDCVHDPDHVAISDTRCVVNQDDTGLEWNPVLYTVDLLVPIVDFGNKGRWHMADEDKWVSTAFTATGWVLATTAAAGMTRALRRTNSG
ncbi:oxidoreductase [Saccharomonospora sp. CUA-673]|uniref:oxidoreductase n=1 Tax=Saccharomonospora sp. CUA-673 TaxID=1904969 RepID=UPI00095C6442|nr:oxidoreductase [Saccharomonospora sp. CUA-673]OLT38741.1 oxidoreductase [Saccharomonospora sp. CUA-673]